MNGAFGSYVPLAARGSYVLLAPQAWATKRPWLNVKLVNLRARAEASNGLRSWHLGWHRIERRFARREDLWTLQASEPEVLAWVAEVLGQKA